MKHLKTYEQHNESIKSKIATGMLALGLAGCGPSDNKDQVSRDTTEVASPSVKDIELTNNFIVDQDILSIGSDFHIKSGSNKCGVVEERVFSWGKTFEYLTNDTLVSRAEQRVISWGVKIDVYDESKNKIGSIEEEILEGLFSIKTIYSIKDSSDNIVGKSKKLDFFGTDVDIYNDKGDLIVTMTRPMINILSDTWTINIKSDEIDKRILVFIPCYKTSVDDEREDEDDDKNDE